MHRVTPNDALREKMVAKHLRARDIKDPRVLDAFARVPRHEFVPFAMLFMNAPIKLDYLWAGLCMLGAVYFIFRA